MSWFGDGIQGRADEVDVECAMADEIRQFAANNSEKGLGGVTVSRRRVLHFRPELKVVNIERYLAIPGRCQIGCFEIRHFA